MNFEKMSVEELLAERKKRKDWIDSPANDGRLSTGSSDYLDHCWDIIDEIEAELLKPRLWMNDDNVRVRDSEPSTTQSFCLSFIHDNFEVRAQVWRWRGYDKWSWAAKDNDGNYHEDRPDAPDAKLFDTVEEAKRHALTVAGIFDK